MILSPSPKQQFFGNNGRPLDGGLVYTYLAGTNTKVATYQNEAGTPNTNPIVLDFRGEANIWLDPEQTYKFVLSPRGDTDPPTNPIWSVDDVAAGLTVEELTQQFLGRILWPRTEAEIAAGVTPEKYWYMPGDPQGSILRYGAVADGITDDHDAVQDALNVEGLVTFPPHGAVKVDSGLTMDMATTTLNGNGGALLSGLSSAGALLTLGSSGGTEQCTRNVVQNLAIGGDNTAGVIGIDINASAQLSGASLEYVSIYGFETLVRLSENAFCLNFNGCTFKSAGDIVFHVVAAVEAAERITFNYCTIANSPRAFVTQRSSCQLFINATSIDYCNIIAQALDGLVFFDNCYVESNTDAGYWFVTGTGETASVQYRGGVIAIVGAKTNYELAYADTGSVILFDTVRFFSTTNSVGGDFLGDGPGATYARNCFITGFLQNALAWAGGSPSQSMCSNGDFTTDLGGWTVSASGGSNVPVRNATAGSGGGPALEFHTNLAATDSRAYWEIAAEPGQVLGAQLSSKSENVDAAIVWVIQCLGNDDVVISSSDVLNGINNFNASFPAANTNYGAHRVALTRAPAGTTKARLVFVSDYSSGYKVWIENVSFCKY